jgi:hypothetical protein
MLNPDQDSRENVDDILKYTELAIKQKDIELVSSVKLMAFYKKN